MQITAVLPVSRVEYLDRVLDSLLKQTHKPQNILVIYDGPQDQYLQARNKVVGSDFNAVLFLQSNNTRTAFTIFERRKHIANIHNQARELLVGADWIFSIEDDGILPHDALERLVRLVNSHEDAGMVTGVELGRWGVPYVGAWRVDDVNEPKLITSLENKTLQEPTTVEEIDACGLYCALIRADLYQQHRFFSENSLGPDVNLGLYIKQRGFKNYIDWGIPLTHLTKKDNVQIELSATGQSRIVQLRLLSSGMWQSSTLTQAQ